MNAKSTPCDKRKSTRTHVGLDDSTTGLGGVFARLFSPNIIRMLSCGQRPKLIDEVLDYIESSHVRLGEITYEDLFRFAYAQLVRHYRNEYIYKNAIANNILLGVHNLNTSHMLQEFRVINCKADTVILNGTSNAYEIKSELDSFERLERQINAYLRVFDLVHVVASPGSLSKISDRLPEVVGLLTLKPRGNAATISTIKAATPQKSNVHPLAIFDSLRRPEYQAIIRDYFGKIPDAPNTKMYAACKEIFATLPPEVAHDAMVKVLKKRGNSSPLKTFIQNVPTELKAIALVCKLNGTEMKAFGQLLSTPVPQRDRAA